MPPTPSEGEVTQHAGEPGDETVSAKRRRSMVRNALINELAGAGVLQGVVNRSENGEWDLEGLVLGGRILVTGSKNSIVIARLWRWVRERRDRKKWGALASPAWGVGAGVEVRIPLEEFAVLVGKLDQLMLERERWLNGPPAGDDPGERGR